MTNKASRIIRVREMQLDNANETNVQQPGYPTYTCPECNGGQMIRTGDENALEYSDSYTCIKCQHRGNITSLAIIISQALTGIIGLIMCSFLLVSSLISAFGFMQSGVSTKVWQQSALAMLALAFIAGFFYIALQAHKAIKNRKRYRSRK